MGRVPGTGQAARGFGAAALCLALGACGALGSYGPREDHSRFEGAALMPGGTVLLSFSHLVYRPAAGITAFPDGGIPRYLEDEAVLAVYQIPTDDLRVLRRTRNERWTDGQGRFSIQRTRGTMALVTQGGQLRRDLAKNVYEDWLVDAVSGAAKPVPWRADLAARGLAMTELYLLDARGTLLFVTKPAAPGPGRGGDADPQLWVRTPRGNYVLVARTSHYERMAGNDLVYWLPETRRFKAFNVVTHGTRDLPDYREPPFEDVVEGVSIETGGQRLLLGRKDGGGAWAYEPLPLDPVRLK